MLENFSVKKFKMFVLKIWNRVKKYKFFLNTKEKCEKNVFEKNCVEKF